MKKWLILLLVLVLISCQQGEPANTQRTQLEGELNTTLVETTVSRVVDGDTIVIASGDKVRLILVNCPESVHPDERRNTPFGKTASDFTRSKLQGQTIFLEQDISDTDQYGRLLRYVYLEDGTFYNELLVKEGYAQLATYPPDVKYLEVIQAAESYAREHGLGLWAEQGALEGYVGSINSDKYHLPSCKYVSTIKPKNIISFENEVKAEAAGYSPCSYCLLEQDTD